MHILRTAAVAAALLSLALPARAQDAAPPADTTRAAIPADTTPRTALQKGNWSLSFAFPTYGNGGGSEFGAWEMVGARTNLGLFLGLFVYGTDTSNNVGDDLTTASTDVSVGVNVKRYLMAPRTVTPYLLGSASIGGRFERREGNDQYEETVRGMNTSVRASVGAEWFPVRRMSVYGHTGFGFFSGRTETELDLSSGEHREADSRSAGFNSFTSVLSVQIYF